MTESVWLYVNVPNGIVKVFGSYDTANEWLCQNDPYGVAVEYPVEEGWVHRAEANGRASAAWRLSRCAGDFERLPSAK